MTDNPTRILPQDELGALLATTVQSVLDAQRLMDDYARKQTQVWLHTPQGEIGLPPLSYIFRNVSVELEMSAAVTESRERGDARPLLVCRLLNPQSVGLYGYQAAAGMKVRLVVGPNGAPQIKSETGNQPPEHSMGSRATLDLPSGLRTGTTPIGDNLLVDVGGQVGVFTPLVTKTEAPSDPAGQKNVQTIVDALRGEIAALQKTNQALETKLTALAARPSAPDDLAAAVQNSVDELQRRLSSMTNPVSDFAIREFRLEATVRIDISELGKIHYYFVRPGEEVDARSLSKITLDIAPIPKQNDPASTAALRLESSVRTMPFLDEAQLSALEKGNVNTIGDFIAAGTRARSAIELSALLRVDRDKLALQVTRAELLAIPGIHSALLASLDAVGVKDAAALAAFAPAALVESLAKLVPPVTITVDEATTWTNAARRLAALRG